MSAIKRNPILAVFITVFIDMLGVGIIIPIFAPLIVRNEYGLMPLATSEATRNLTYGILSATFAIFQFFGAPILGGSVVGWQSAARYFKASVLPV